MNSKSINDCKIQQMIVKHNKYITKYNKICSYTHIKREGDRDLISQIVHRNRLLPKAVLQELGSEGFDELKEQHEGTAEPYDPHGLWSIAIQARKG